MKEIYCPRCHSKKPVPDGWRYKLCPKCKEYVRNYIREYRETHPKYVEENRNQASERMKKNRLKVLTHYGGNPPKCACCGETIIEFLEIDHIYGEGNRERKIVRKKYGNFMTYLIRQGFPKGFQVLCANCNRAKGSNKKRFCPIHHPELY